MGNFHSTVSHSWWLLQKHFFFSRLWHLTGFTIIQNFYSILFVPEVIKEIGTVLSTRMYYSSFKSFMCGVLKCCGLVACKLNIICVYAPLILGTGISVDSAPAMQAL